MTVLVSKKNQVFIAMLSLDTFTAEELSRFSGIVIATVRTIIGRNESKLERVAIEPTNQRGGQRIRYRLTDEGRRELTAIVETGHAQLRSAAPAWRDKLAAVLPLGDALPLGLRLASDTTGRLFAEATTLNEKLELLEVAEGEAKSALQEIDDAHPAIAQRIEKEVQDKLADIQKKREAITPPEPEFYPLLNPAAAELAPLGLRIWSGISMKSSFTKRIAKDLQTTAKIVVSEVPEDSTETEEIGTAVVLLVDSANVKKARVQFDRAVRISKAAHRPLAVLDKGYDQAFRKHVYGCGITIYCNDAASLDANSTRVVISGVLPSTLSRAIQLE